MLMLMSHRIHNTPNVVQNKSTAGAQHAQPCVLYMQDLQRLAGATNSEKSGRKPCNLQ